MRGLKLFVRPLEPADHDAVSAFLAAHSGGTPPALGLLGKLLGDIVAVVALQPTPEGLRVQDIVVAGPLRRKWIGRLMMREVETLAGKLEQDQLVVENAGEAGEFFRRVGFEREGERWIRGLPGAKRENGR